MKILLLTDVPPCTQYSGALLTDQLCRYVPSTDIICIVVKNENLTEKTSEDLGIETIYLTKPPENTFRLLNGRVKLFTFYNELINEIFITPKLTKKIIGYGRENKVDRVWCILQGQTIIRLAIDVAEGLNVPLLTQVWDHPDWWIGHNKLDKFSAHRIRQSFNAAIKKSSCCGTASIQMANKYKEKYQIPALPLLACLSENVAHQPREFPSNKDQLVIGFSGQTYADQAIQGLYSVLDKLDWKINGKSVKIRILSYAFSVYGHKKWNIEFLGYREQKESIDLLAGCDLLYLPYITDPSYEEVAQTSFPSKLTAYLATGVPVLFVGTNNSSPARFLLDNNCGYFCTDITEENLTHNIQEIFSNRVRYETISKNSLVTFQKFLTTEKQKDSFIKFLRYGELSYESSTDR